jgi:hypothetical protein
VGDNKERMMAKTGLARSKSGKVSKAKKAKSQNEVLAKIAGMTKAGGSKKETSKTKLYVDGHEDLVDRVVERSKEIESLETEQELDLQEVRGLGTEAMREEEGIEFHRTCRIRGTEQDVRVTRKDAFSKIAIEHKGTLQDLLGSMYETLFMESCDLKLTVDPEVFIAAAEEAGLNVEKFFNRVDWVRPKKGFLEMRATLRPKLEEDENTALDAIIDQFAYKASVGMKG